MREKNTRLQMLVMAMIEHYGTKQVELDEIDKKYTAKIIADTGPKSL